MNQKSDRGQKRNLHRRSDGERAKDCKKWSKKGVEAGGSPFRERIEEKLYEKRSANNSRKTSEKASIIKKQRKRRGGKNHASLVGKFTHLPS